MIRWKLKLFLQFLYYVLFNKGDFKLSIKKRLSLAFGGGFTANQFYIFNLEKNDRKEYLSEYDWFKSRKLNKPYDYILNDKFLFYEIIGQYAPIPEVYAVRKNGSIAAKHRNCYDENEILNLVVEKGDVIFKVISSGKGNGVFHFNVTDEEKIYINGRQSSDNELISVLEKYKDWMITERICQADYADRIYSGCLNTIRIIAVKDPKSCSFKITNAVHRFGTSSTGAVDNASKGGLVSHIDIDSGSLSEAMSIRSLNVYVDHPDTGARIKGITVPDWDGLKKKIIEISNHFFYLKMIAWDVAITPEGLKIIEANSSSGVNILQLWEGQRNRELGEFFRFYNVIR